MKRIIFYTLIFLTACIAGVHAQQFPSTRGGTVCASCAGGYDIITGNPSLSNIFALAGEPQLSWQGQLGTQKLPIPYGDFIDSYTILTLENSTISQSKVQKIISGFQPGKTYTIRYKVLSSRTANSGYGKSATMTITTTGEFPFVTTVGSRTTTFGSNTNVWISEAFTFTASATELVFHLTGGTSASGVNNNLGYVNFDIIDFPLDCILPTNQVQLSQTVLTTPFPCGKVNLNSVVTSTTPEGGKLVWQYGTSFPKGYASHLTDANSEAAGVAANEYMAFYYSEVNQCYNTNSSTAGVQVKHVPTQVSLKRNILSNACPSNTVSLESVSNTPVSQAIGIKWFNNASHQGAELDPKSITSSGTYYAFLYDLVNGCFSTDLSTAKVNVTISSCESCGQINDAVILSKDNTGNTCPVQTVDLNSFVLNGAPQGTTLVWFTGLHHSGTKVVDPTKVAVSGTYYAYFYNAANDCYSADDGGNNITVTITNCPPTKVNLNLKVFLQGATTQENGVATMRNDLQKFPTSVSTYGLLPTQDPYGGGEVFADINSTLSENKIVDWVKVEIRSMQNPAVILESKSLLLRPDGSVVDKDGFAPKFNPQFGGVRIAVKHRNHLGVLGLGIVSFNAGTINYDFSADLSKAYQVVPKPQMILKNGVWCMIAGDANSDLLVDSGDVPSFNSAFKASLSKTYHLTDLNMDGVLDSADVTIFNNNFKAGYYSSITKYIAN
ncbi:hypothetical protein [Dyadobacter sp. CY351]|uniref:hypothetical protein n=1 Tax=Dyadobacter sp. CY351 TaxID=2909337 RepID=UPI001F40F6B8|nr:hypothetical protein [Dyadobacter sp. CY351]MCF2520669.1 hypothetical protein [Dyadobacter sp. CY351]